MVTESNITNHERQYRNFCGLVSAYKPGIDIEKVSVERTPKGNWRVYDQDCNRVCLVSRNILSDELIDAKSIKRCEPSN